MSRSVLASPRAVTFSLVMASVAVGNVAHAQAMTDHPFPEPAIRADEPTPSPLDGRVLTGASVQNAGILFYRGVDHDHWSLGVFNLELGQEIRTHTFPFYLVSTRASSLRMYDDKSYGIAFFQDIGGGIALGRFEPEIHVGAHLFEFDVFHTNWNVSTLSPRVSAEVGIRFGKMRVEVEAFSQYLWRWYGEGYFARGFSVGVQFDQPKTRFP